MTNNKIYIGQSIDISRRWKDHKKCLRKNIHRNIHLQSAWNKYGESKFIHKAIEYCKVNELNEREIYWIIYFNSNNQNYGYNLDFGGGSLKSVSDETRRKLSESSSGANNHAARKVVCIETGEIFDTIKDAESKYNIPKGVIGHCCRGERIWSNGYHWAYYEDYISYSKNDLKRISKRKPHRNFKKVINLNTGIIYLSMAQAERDTGISQYKISSCCRGQSKSCGETNNGEKIIFKYYDEYLKMSQLDIDSYKLNMKSPFRKVICLNTGKIFNKICEASDWCNLKSSSPIINCCKKRNLTAGKHPITGESLKWEYYNET